MCKRRIVFSVSLPLISSTKGHKLESLQTLCTCIFCWFNVQVGSFSMLTSKFKMHCGSAAGSPLDLQACGSTSDSVIAETLINVTRTLCMFL